MIITCSLCCPIVVSDYSLARRFWIALKRAPFFSILSLSSNYRTLHMCYLAYVWFSKHRFVEIYLYRALRPLCFSSFSQESASIRALCAFCVYFEHRESFLLSTSTGTRLAPSTGDPPLENFRHCAKFQKSFSLIRQRDMTTQRQRSESSKSSYDGIEIGRYDIVWRNAVGVDKCEGEHHNEELSFRRIFSRPRTPSPSITPPSSLMTEDTYLALLTCNDLGATYSK